MKLYRFEDYMDESGSLGVMMMTVNVVKETPQGYWYSPYYNGKKWTSKNGARRKWCDSKEDALKSYKYRKQHELRFVTARLRKVTGILEHLDSVDLENFTGQYSVQELTNINQAALK